MQQMVAELLTDPRNRGNVSPALADLMLAAAVGAAAISFGVRKTANAYAVAFSSRVRHTIDKLIERELRFARHESNLPGADRLAE
ncbi:hypothetical protein ACG04R_25360 [Roseateles sp. BYS78W]|uniref:Uncharacterized protein n=1 Tax=Pelomonas candidula TaxID=3299025 RepID=A0ABW7HJI0_9BURK